MTTTKLEYLFQLYASDLARFAPTLAGCFGCPLCYKTIEWTPALKEVVAEEHIIPHALGGRITTLTCRKCNNDNGSDLDSHLVQRARVETGRFPVGARVYIGDSDYGALVDLPKSTSDPFDIVAVPKQSGRRKLDAAMHAMQSGETEFQLRINFGYNHRRSLVGLLRAAYLLMFRYFGYGYVLDASARPIQRQIQHPLEPTVALNGINWRISDPVPVENVVAIMHQPQEFQCIFVILQLDTQTKHYAGIALPPPGQDGAEFYERLQSQGVGGSQQLVAIPRLNGDPLPMLEVWEHYTRTT